MGTEHRARPEGRPARMPAAVLPAGLRVLVCHRRDAHAAQLVRQLESLGCCAVQVWPPPAVIPGNVELLLYQIDADLAPLPGKTGDGSLAVPLVAVLTGQDAASLAALLAVGADAVLPGPVPSSGVLLPALLLARAVHARLSEARQRAVRLEQKLQSAQLIAQAKAILVRARGTSDEGAYRLLREQAMSRRTTVEDVARAVVAADSVLSFPSRGG